jgi:hypothetical protein
VFETHEPLLTESRVPAVPEDQLVGDPYESMKSVTRDR